MTRRTIPWGRATAELAIVALGVLSALWVESFREARAERRMERQYMERLVDDLVADSATMERIRHFHRLYRRSATQLVEIIEGAYTATPDTTEVMHMMAWAGYLDSTVLQRATFDDMVSSGRLGLIRDPDLVRDVLQYYKLAEGRIGSFDAAPREFSQLARRWLPAGFTGSAQYCIWAEWTGVGGHSEPRCRVEILKSRAAAVLDRLLNHADVAGYLNEVVWYTDRIEDSFQSQDGFGASLRADLRSALGKQGWAP
jgi:hypothetical protein